MKTKYTPWLTESDESWQFTAYEDEPKLGVDMFMVAVDESCVGKNGGREQLQAFLTTELLHGMGTALQAQVHIRASMNVTIRLSLDHEKAKAEIAHLLDVFLRGDMVSQTEAARSIGVSLHTINAAVKDGRLRAYHNPQAPNPRKGGRLVSLAEVNALWADKS